MAVYIDGRKKSRYVRNYDELLEYKPRSFNRDAWNVAIEIVPETYFW